MIHLYYYYTLEQKDIKYATKHAIQYVYNGQFLVVGTIGIYII